MTVTDERENSVTVTVTMNVDDDACDAVPPVDEDEPTQQKTSGCDCQAGEGEGADHAGGAFLLGLVGLLLWFRRRERSRPRFARFGLGVLVMVSAYLGGVSEAHADPLPVDLGVEVSGEVVDPEVPVVFTFQVDPGAVVYVARVASDNADKLNWVLTDSVGRVVAADLAALDDLGPVTLMGGAYQVAVSGEDGGTGTFTFVIHPVTHTLSSVATNAPVSGALTSPGQIDRYTFVIGPGERFSFDGLDADDGGKTIYSLTDSLGRVIRDFDSDWDDSGPFHVPPDVYTLTVKGEGAHVGAYSFQIQAFQNPDEAITLGQEVAGGIAFQGQASTYTFTLVETRTVAVDILSVDGFAFLLSWAIESGLGDIVFPKTSGPGDMGPFKLQPGDYTITVSAGLAHLTDYTFRVTAVETEAGGLTLDEEVNGEIDLPFQEVTYAFTAPAGQAVFLDRAGGGTDFDLAWRIEDALGRVVAEDTNSFADEGPITLLGEYARTTREWEGTAVPIPNNPLSEFEAVKPEAFTFGGRFAFGADSLSVQRREFAVSAEFSKFISGEKGSPWRRQNQSVLGLSWFPVPNVDLFGEFIHVDGYVPLNFLSGGNFPDGSTWADNDAKTDVLMFGAQGAF